MKVNCQYAAISSARPHEVDSMPNISTGKIWQIAIPIQAMSKFADNMPSTPSRAMYV